MRVKTRQKVALPVLLLFMSLLLSGCIFMPREEEVIAPPIKEPEKVSYETFEAKKGTIENKIRCTGYFVSSAQYDLFFRYRGGRLKAVNVKAGDYVKKGDQIAELETENLENDIKLQRLVLKKAQVAYDKLKTMSDIAGGGSKFDLEIAALDLESAELKLNGLLMEMERSKIYSPIDGKIISLNDIKLGENIDAYTTLVRVADPGALQLQYSEDKAARFRLGMKVEVDMDDKKYPGEVVATPMDAPKDSDEITKASVKINVQGLPKEVSLGDSALITLVLEKRENVIVLSKRDVNNFINRNFVNVLKDGIREERNVELGIQSDTEVEIVKGLEVGELVISR